MSITDLLVSVPEDGKNVPHEYRSPSMIGHGEAQCVWCYGTNRENAIVAPNHCERRALKDPIYGIPLSAEKLSG